MKTFLFFSALILATSPLHAETKSAAATAGYAQIKPFLEQVYVLSLDESTDTYAKQSFLENGHADLLMKAQAKLKEMGVKAVAINMENAAFKKAAGPLACSWAENNIPTVVRISDAKEQKSFSDLMTGKTAAHISYGHCQFKCFPLSNDPNELWDKESGFPKLAAIMSMNPHQPEQGNPLSCLALRILNDSKPDIKIDEDSVSALAMTDFRPGMVKKAPIQDLLENKLGKEDLAGKYVLIGPDYQTRKATTEDPQVSDSFLNKAGQKVSTTDIQAAYLATLLMYQKHFGGKLPEDYKRDGVNQLQFLIHDGESK